MKLDYFSAWFLILVLFATFAATLVGELAAMWESDRVAYPFLEELEALPKKPGMLVYVFDAGQPDWHGKAELVARKLAKLIAIARELNLMEEELLPIRVGVRRFRFMEAHAGPRSSMALAARRLESGEWLDEVLAHEFAHLLSPPRGNLVHHEKWSEVCGLILARLPGDPKVCAAKT